MTVNHSVPRASRRFAIILALVLTPLLFTTAPATAAKGPALPYKSINALFELTHPEGLQGFAKAVSTPGSKKYQQYRSVNWIVKRYGAKPKAKKKAMRWLAARGIDARPDATGQALLATMNEKQAARFVERGATVSSASDGGEGRVPAGLADVVTGVGFLDSKRRFHTNDVTPEEVQQIEAATGGFSPTFGSARGTSGTPAGCAAGQGPMPNTTLKAFTPNQYLDAYGHSTLHKQGFKGQGMTMAVVEIDGFQRSDLETFGECFETRVPPTPISLAGIKTPLAAGGETTLDLEVISAAAPGLEKIHVYQGQASEVGLMDSMGSALGKNLKSQPDTISMSIGGCEPELRGQLQFRRGIDNILAVAAGAGIPFFISTGDVGSAGCTLDDNQTAVPILAVQDPASSKFATAVGGSNFSLNAQNQITEEVVWNDGPDAGAGAGAGGISILEKRSPWYQRTKAFGGVGPTRAMPDMVGLADSWPGYAIYCSAPGQAGCQSIGWFAVGGTSAATPLMAAGMTLVNQKRKKSGKKSLGFINPLLYKIGGSKAYGSAIRDITVGNNDTGPAIPRPPGMDQGPLGCCTASKGFDLASGWGSLKLTGFAKAANKYNPKKKNRKK